MVEADAAETNGRFMLACGSATMTMIGRSRLRIVPAPRDMLPAETDIEAAGGCAAANSAGSRVIENLTRPPVLSLERQD